MNKELKEYTEKEIRLIATDMDGTLLDSQKRLPADILSVVRALKAKGVSFVIASGRQYGSLRRDMGELVPDIAFIAENGALVVENDERLFIDPLSPQSVRDTLAAARDLARIYPVVCRADTAVVEAGADPAFIRGVQTFYENMQIVPDLLEYADHLEDVCKVAFYDEGDAAANAFPLLQARVPGGLSVVLSGENWVDIMKPGVSKGRAMRMLQEIKGIAREECMAFGDYLNDLTLLESAQESYAMENARPEIKRIARYIAPGNDENGVMRVIRARFGL